MAPLADEPADPPRRVRVPTGGEPRSAPPAAGAGAEPAATMREDGAVYLRGLARSQFRLALGTLLAFLVVILAFTAVLSLLPEWGDPVILGVPLSWLLQAYGYYPIIAVFAIAYVRGAHANERRYRELVSGPSTGTERR